MKLYGTYPSPFVRHCRIALIESNCPWTFIETDGKASSKLTPTQKIPVLEHNGLQINDSFAIVKYIRELNGQKFLSSIEDFDKFCLLNTALDSCINLFLLERSGLSAEDNVYLRRQQSRITSTLQEMNAWQLNTECSGNDLMIRLACYLQWGEFRHRFSLNEFPALKAFLGQVETQEAFRRTAPR